MEDIVMEEIVEHDTSETIVEDVSIEVEETPLEVVQEEIVTSSVLDSTEATNILDTSIDITGKAPDKKIEKVVQLPLTRIKALMKLDPDVNLASQDSVIAVAKAAELFVYMLGKEAYKFTKQNKKKTIQKKDINDCISSCEALAFLEGTLKED